MENGCLFEPQLSVNKLDNSRRMFGRYKLRSMFTTESGARLCDNTRWLNTIQRGDSNINLTPCQTDSEAGRVLISVLLCVVSVFSVALW
jgi:hypothetical protein